MSFSIEDPLAELLSDNSLENDSFFENAIQRTPNKASRTKLSRVQSTLMIREEDEEQEEESKSKKVTSTPYARKTYGSDNVGAKPRITTQQPTLENDNDELGFDPKKPKTKAANAGRNILDDLLGSGDIARPATAKPTTSRSSISRQSTDSAEQIPSNLPVPIGRPKTSTGRRGSNHSIERLGLFSAQFKKETSSGPSTPKMLKREKTADWLGLNVNTNEKQMTKVDEATHKESNKSTELIQKNAEKNDSNKSIDILRIPDENANESETNESINIDNVRKFNHNNNNNNNGLTENILKLSNMNFETKSSYSILSHRESQLAIAAQMKTQERVLLEMQQRQETLLQQQERQFQNLLNEQIQRQQQMEENIKIQQQRINAHLQLMMSQPDMIALPTTVTVTATAEPVQENVESSGKSPREFHVQKEAELRHLECERLHLEELNANMKANYEKEIQVIENSFSKQMQMLESHLEAVEQRLRSENDQLKQHYESKIETLEKEKQKNKSDYDTDLTTYKQEHEDEIRRLRKTQEDDLEMLKEEHRRMIETIRQAKMIEFAAIQENGNYLETLKAATHNLENLSGGLQDLREDMHQKLDLLYKEREHKLEVREKRLDDTERRLKITEENADSEKQRLMELVGTLEVQLGQLSKDSAEESWVLRQKLASLEAEKMAFEREKQYAREQMARDERRIQDLKEQQLADAKRVMTEIQTERELLSTERTKLETERKLNPTGADVEKQRAEIEASLQIAKDASRSANAERERYQKLTRQLEQQKRELNEKENYLRAKEDEIEHELNSYRLAERRSQEAQQKARNSERILQQKLQYLQQRTRELGDKEAMLSQERLIISKERIGLKNLRAAVNERKCTLCKMNDQTQEIEQMLNRHSSGSTLLQNSKNLTTSYLSNNELNIINSMSPEELRNIYSNPNMVERMLDESIADSLRKMKVSTGMNLELLAESVLDDDSKELALNKIDDFHFSSSNEKETETAKKINDN